MHAILFLDPSLARVFQDVTLFQRKSEKINFFKQAKSRLKVILLAVRSPLRREKIKSVTQIKCTFVLSCSSLNCFGLNSSLLLSENYKPFSMDYDYIINFSHF